MTTQHLRDKRGANPSGDIVLQIMHINQRIKIKMLESDTLPQFFQKVARPLFNTLFRWYYISKSSRKTAVNLDCLNGSEEMKTMCSSETSLNWWTTIFTTSTSKNHRYPKNSRHQTRSLTVQRRPRLVLPCSLKYKGKGWMESACTQ